MMKSPLCIAALTGLLLPLAACDRPEPVLDERMLPEAEAVARETLEAADESPAPERAPGTVPGTRIAIPGAVQPAVAVVCEHGCGVAAVSFDAGSSDLDDEATDHLDQMAACLRGEGGGFDLDDYRPDPNDAVDYDDDLARERARAVGSYLEAQGADEGSFEVVAVGARGAIASMPRLYPRYAK